MENTVNLHQSLPAASVIIDVCEHSIISRDDQNHPCQGQSAGERCGSAGLLSNDVKSIQTILQMISTEADASTCLELLELLLASIKQRQTDEITPEKIGSDTILALREAVVHHVGNFDIKYAVALTLISLLEKWNDNAWSLLTNYGSRGEFHYDSLALMPTQVFSSVVLCPFSFKCVNLSR